MSQLEFSSHRMGERSRIEAEPESEALWHTLPVDLGASCTDFLSIQEQCCIKPTSMNVQKFVQTALRRPHEKGVVFLPHNLSHVASTMTSEQMHQYFTRLIKAIGTACPKIGRFFVSRVADSRIQLNELKEEPVQFHFDVNGVPTTGWPEVRDIASLPCAQYLTRLDINLCYENLSCSTDVIAGTLTHFPSLETLSITALCTYTEPTCCDFAFLEKMAHICNRVSECILTVFRIPCVKCFGALGKFDTLRVLNFKLLDTFYVRVLSRKDTPSTPPADIVFPLPDSLERIVFTAEADERGSLLLGKVSKAFYACFPTWSSCLLEKTVFLDTKLQDEVLLDEMRSWTWHYRYDKTRVVDCAKHCEMSFLKFGAPKEQNRTE